MRRARPYRGENHGPGKDVQGELDLTPGIREPGKDVQGELDLTPGIREQPGSDSDIATWLRDVRSTPKNRHAANTAACLFGTTSGLTSAAANRHNHAAQ